jgi:hypothetical protein
VWSKNHPPTTQQHHHNSTTNSFSRRQRHHHTATTTDTPTYTPIPNPNTNPYIHHHILYPLLFLPHPSIHVAGFAASIQGSKKEIAVAHTTTSLSQDSHHPHRSPSLKSNHHYTDEVALHPPDP